MLRREGLKAAWPYVLVALVGLFVLLPRLGDFGFWDPWEPKYAESAREMIEHHSWVVPFYREDVRLTKPILVYWGVLAGSAVFGLNELGSRIVGVLMALAAMLGVQYGVSTLRGRRAGLFAGLVLGTSPMAYLLARQATPDVYLYTSLGCCLMFLALGLFGPERHRDLHFGIGYACFALAVLAKGPVVAGAVAVGTLLLCAAMHVDVHGLLAPRLRGPTLRFAVIEVAAAAIIAPCGFVAFLFGASPGWWSYSNEGRVAMGALRTRLQVHLGLPRIPEIVLLALAATLALVGSRLARGPLAGTSKARLAAAAGAVIGALAALAAIFFGGQPVRIFAASSLLGLSCAALAVGEVRRYLGHPLLWPAVQPWVKPVVRQLLLFLAVFAVVAGPWHVAILIDQGHGYFTDFLLKHNAERLVETVNSTGTTEFYVRSLIYGMFPWSCLLPVALIALVDWRRRDPFRTQGLEALMLVACLVTFVAFSCSDTKFTHYLSPILVPAAVAIGLIIDRTLAERDALASRLIWIVAAMLFVLPVIDIMGRGGSELLVGAVTVKQAVPENLEPGTYYHALVFIVLAGLFCGALVRSRLIVGVVMLAATLMAHETATRFIPALSVHKSMKYLTDSWKAAGPADPLCFYGELKHGMYFYSDNKVQRLVKPETFVDFMNPDRRAFCVVEKKHVRILDSAFRRRNPSASLKMVDASHMNYCLLNNQGAASDPQLNPTVVDVDE